jgi:hypothetical protein
MQYRKTFWLGRLAPLLMAGVLGLAAPARAQEEAVSDSRGRPLDGYLATLTLCGLALFIIGKSARR